jgi:DNA-binding transcriptional LysR family regulator
VIVEIRPLRYFLVLADELHFGRAAERLGIAQPGLTQQMQRLEAELGVALFDRSQRRVRLTAAGAVLLEEGRRVQAQFERAVLLTERAGRGEVGRLTLGVGESGSYAVLPDLLRAYRGAYPDVDLSVRVMPTPAQVAAVRSEEIDAGLARLPVAAEGLGERTIREDALAVLLPEGHRLAQAPDLALGDLAGEPLVLHPAAHRSGWGDFMLAVLREAGVEPGPVQEASDPFTAVAFVAAGLGVTLVPSYPGLFARPQVVWRALREPAPRSRLVLLYRQDGTPATVSALLHVVDRLWPRTTAGDRAPGHGAVASP